MYLSDFSIQRVYVTIRSTPGLLHGHALSTPQTLHTNMPLKKKKGPSKGPAGCPGPGSPLSLGGHCQFPSQSFVISSQKIPYPTVPGETRSSLTRETALSIFRHRSLDKNSNTGESDNMLRQVENLQQDLHAGHGAAWPDTEN